MKMQASLKKDHVLGSFCCKTPQQLFSLSNTVDAIKTRFLEDVSPYRGIYNRNAVYSVGYIGGIKRILYENTVFLRNVESSLYRDATRFLVQTE